VAAEEAFNKACNNPEIFISEESVIEWATLNDYLNGAIIYNVLQTMQNYGFQISGSNNNDGPFFTVNWLDNNLLQNAIANFGPVKLGVASEAIINIHKKHSGWFITGLPKNTNIDHCVSLCGYGTFQWLASQFNVTVPSGLDPNQQGFAIFTWGSIGIIDIQSLQNIIGEAWVRKPTNTIAYPKACSFNASGAEMGKTLSHANDKLWLQTGINGTGEVFLIENISSNTVALACSGAEQGKYLSHANGTVGLINSFSGKNETWKIHYEQGVGTSIECDGNEAGHYLSHANGDVKLQYGCLGQGEIWFQV
jgi:hypothetical protein